MSPCKGTPLLFQISAKNSAITVVICVNLEGILFNGGRFGHIPGGNVKMKSLLKFCKDR